jgi:hypothetical protein
LIDRCFLDLAAARAVRNRRGLLAREIGDTIRTSGERPARVTSLACGPARAASKFGRSCTRIFFEEQQINMFAECIREE